MNKNSKKPIPVLVSGALGRMGSEVVNTVLNSTDCELVAAIDINEKNNGSNISEIFAPFLFSVMSIAATRSQSGEFKTEFTTSLPILPKAPETSTGMVFPEFLFILVKNFF